MTSESRISVRGGRTAAVLLVFGLVGGAPAQAWAQDAGRGRIVVDELALLGGGLTHLITSPARWQASDWLAVPVAGAGLIALSALDAESRDLMRRTRGRDLDRFADVVEELGTINNFSILLGLLTAGYLFDDVRARSAAVEAVASSVIAAGVVTPALQFAVGRSRPWTGEDPHTLSAFSRNISFPSGHTTQAFAVASVIATEYDAPWVRITAYGLASLVGLSRMYHDAHYFTDVAAAAAIGTVVGRSVARYGRKRRGAILLQPSLTTRAPGVGLTLRF